LIVDSASAADRRGKAIAFYLPQFHPIPENDAWWGRGFTEWTNVVAARPRFAGHYQPHLPADLGFYDLRVEETRVAQAAMAREHGIHGFCYYHYWFMGKRLLGRPLDDMLASRRPDFPFCLCWANESWSRTWSGRDHEVLIRQEYSDADNQRHIAWLSGVFEDARYIRIDGRPVFLVYRPQSIPHVAKVMEEWKKFCIRALSVEPFFCAVRTGFSTVDGTGHNSAGFDAVVDFQPSRAVFPSARNVAGRTVALARRTLPASWYEALRNSKAIGKRNLNTVIEYNDYVDAWLRRAAPEGGNPTFPCVFPSWDNSARRPAATIIENHDATAYARWLDAALDRVAGYPADARLVFLNAWNEWAEGCHLEPDHRHGKQFLEATKGCVQQGAGLPGPGGSA
jgi:hypothetical protein